MLFTCFIVLFSSCDNGNYFVEYKTIKYQNLPKEVKLKFDNVLNNYILGDGYLCYDLSEKCKDCIVYRDDKGMLGIFFNRKPHVIIKNCEEVFEVPITFQGMIYVLYNEHLYFPKINEYMGEKKIKEYHDIKKFEYRVISIK